MREPTTIGAALVVTAMLLSPGCTPAASERVLVLAAASTIDALEAAVADYEQQSGGAIDVSFGPTSMAARQIAAGAPADLMLSASTDWADYVESRVAVERRVVVAGNRLVVVAQRNGETSSGTPEAVLFDQATTHVAIADPESVPAGIYASEALRRLSLWERLSPRLVPTIDVRAALTLVIEGEAEIGIVYATDAASTDSVGVVAELDPGLHAPIEYPLLLLAGADPAAGEFFEFLVSDRGRTHFLARGFTRPDR